MSKPKVPVSEANFEPWLEKLIGTPLHKPAPSKPPVNQRKSPDSGK